MFFRRVFEARNAKKERKEIAAFKALQKIQKEKQLNGNTQSATNEIICIEDPK